MTVARLRGKLQCLVLLVRGWIFFRSDDGVQEVGSAEEAAHNFNYSSYYDIGEVNDRHHLNEEDRKKTGRSF